MFLDADLSDRGTPGAGDRAENSYVTGWMGSHNIVIAVLQYSQYGMTPASTVAGEELPKCARRTDVGIAGTEKDPDTPWAMLSSAARTMAPRSTGKEACTWAPVDGC